MADEEDVGIDPNQFANDPAMAEALRLIQEATAAKTAPTNLSLIGLPSGEAPEKLEADEPVGIGKYVMPRNKPPKYPRYYTGYVYMPQAMNWGPVEKRRLQNQLVNAGILQKDYRSGVWDEATQEAFGSLLALANQSGNDWETELVNYAKSQPMEWDAKTGTMKRKAPGGGTLAQRQKLVINHTNPNDLSLLANETAQKRLGRKLSQDELQKFVTSYQSMEGEYQRAADAASEAGGTVTAPMQADTAADLAAQNADPVAYATRGILPAMDAINDLLKGRSFGEAQAMGG